MPETATALKSDENPEEADDDICLSLNPVTVKLAQLAPARLSQATLGRLNRTGAVAMVTLFSACSLTELRKTVKLPSALDGKREGQMEKERNSAPNAYIIQICTHLCFISYFHPFFSICASLSLVGKQVLR